MRNAPFSMRSPIRPGPPSSGSSTSRSTCRPAAEGHALADLEREIRASLNAADARPAAREPPGHGRHPAHAGRRRHGRGRHVGQRALPGLNGQIFAARGEDMRIAIDGAEPCSPTRAASPPRPRARACSCNPGQPGGVRELLERGPGDRGRAGRPGRQLPVPVRPAAGPRPGSPCSSRPRHPAGRAQAAGRAPPGVVRRTLDHVRVRPVRGEHPVLPGPAAALRGRGPAGRAGRRRDPAAGRDEPAQRESTAGTVPSTPSSTASPHLRIENRVLPACRRSRTSWPRRVLYGLSGPWPRAAADLDPDVVRDRGREPARGRAGPHGGPADGPAGQVSVAELVLRRLLPLAREGLARRGVDPALAGLLGIIEQRCLTAGPGPTGRSP